MLRKEITKEKAFERLVSLCNRSEQCESDIVRKMLNWGLPSRDRIEILDSLKSERLVDDLRFAKAFANDKARFSAWGPLKIRAELVRKRIKSALIKEAVQNVDPNVWKEGLLKCAVSKSRNIDLIGEENWNNRQKLFRFLISRGFSSSSASKAVNLMKKKQEEQE